MCLFISTTDIIYGGQAFLVSVGLVDAYKQVVETSIPFISISVVGQNGTELERKSDYGYLGQVSYNFHLYLFSRP